MKEKKSLVKTLFKTDQQSAIVKITNGYAMSTGTISGPKVSLFLFADIKTKKLSGITNRSAKTPIPKPKTLGKTERIEPSSFHGSA